eukprot:TRINITY_DN802_c0_g1_i1.p1 TRINITY_DN802_c0_g1~~TRINITY_DN802_c0_g1_i1.p1  ORF type:complete len:1140 (+),score=371.06 TRINITY_DN802_c0_g1_i1:186-3605(+)
MSQVETPRASLKRSAIELLRAENVIPESVLQVEVDHFFGVLGINEYYFQTTEATIVANHILSIYAAKILAKCSANPTGGGPSLDERDCDGNTIGDRARSPAQLDVHLEKEQKNDALYVVGSQPGVTRSPAMHIERRLESKYLNEGYRPHNSQKTAGTSLPRLNSHTSFKDLNKDVSVTRSRNDNTTRVACDDASRFRLQCYRTQGTVSPSFSTKLRIYNLQRPVFKDGGNTQHQGAGIIDAGDDFCIDDYSDVTFLASASANTKKFYANILKKGMASLGPVIDAYEYDNGEHRVVICYRHGTTHSFFSGLTHLYHHHGFHSSRKYIEQFSNGFTVMSIYLIQIKKNKLSSREEIKERINKFVDEVSLLYILPRTALSPLFENVEITAAEMSYAYAAWKFAHQFLTSVPKSREYKSLYDALQSRRDDTPLSLLVNLKNKLKKDAFTEGVLLEAIREYPNLIRALYYDFANYHTPEDDRRPTDEDATSGLSAEIPKYDPKHGKDLKSEIVKNVSSEVQQQVFLAFLHFNRHVLKTNFYKPNKTALSFRLDPRFISRMADDISESPFGVFFIVGSEFRGFHVRFRDVARGGVRIIRSPNNQAYANNVSSLFGENYNLALTQQLKNKDIPEGGSKGTILLSWEHQTNANAASAFRKYMDAMLDLILVNSETDPTSKFTRCTTDVTPPSPMPHRGQTKATPETSAPTVNAPVDTNAPRSASAPTLVFKKSIVDHYGLEEIIFFGPDEGTADLMNWASQYAHRRGMHFWKAITTGKSPQKGGIPHDTYGMTTQSVHTYVVNALKADGVDEASCTKFQTGGPDGDLGSNEIKLSKDRTTAVVDGSGVLYDPAGLDRVELVRLANNRQTVGSFDRSKLGEGGFYVSINDRDITLPNGTKVDSGLAFRNTFHLSPLSTADIFVPCGGRPAAVNVNNWEQMLDDKGKPRFRYIIEGANLFFTQTARLELERAGAVVVKDAAANKGGVTSSSLEVLAALALNDEEFAKHMCVGDDEVTPEFYAAYVVGVQEKIRENAFLEFTCLWKEHKSSGTERTILSDKISQKINHLTDYIGTSSLWRDPKLKARVLAESLPKNLVDLVGGLDVIVERVPESYLRAIFSSYLASRYVYKFGLTTAEMLFFEFIREYLD